MENKILEEVIVEEVPEIVSGGLNKGLVGGLIGSGVTLVGVVAYKKVAKPMIEKIKAKKATKNGEDINDHEEDCSEEI